MISLSQICSTKAKVEVDFDGEKLVVWHNPSVFTAEFEMQAREDLKQNEASQFLISTLSHLLVEWELVDDTGTILGEDHKGEVVPTDAGTLKRVPFAILIKVSNAISEAHGSSESEQTKNSDGGTQTPSGSFS